MFTQLLTTITRHAQRVFAFGVVFVCLLPAMEAQAVTKHLSDALWQTTGFCLDQGSDLSDSVEVMTPDARSYQMSIELRALRDMLRVQRSEQVELQSSIDEPTAELPCDASEKSDENGAQAAVCTTVEQDTQEEVYQFVAISLLEDIAPLEAPDMPSNSCQASSSGPDRCESHPPLPQRLILDVTLSAAVLPAHATPPPYKEKAHTLPLQQAHARSLLQEATGHPMKDKQPPQTLV